MALEQQKQQIAQHANQGTHSGEKSQASFQSQAGFIAANGSMNVSFYYIPHMSSVVEATRVRKALLHLWIYWLSIVLTWMHVI